MNISRIAAVMEKESKEILRDPITLAVALLMPLVMLFLFGYAISLDLNDVRLGVLDQDCTPTSRQLIDRFVESGYFRRIATFATTHEVEDGLQRDVIKLALVIPVGFQDNRTAGRMAPVQVLVDDT